MIKTSVRPSIAYLYVLHVSFCFLLLKLATLVCAVALREQITFDAKIRKPGSENININCK